MADVGISRYDVCFAQHVGELYQEIATVATLPRNDILGGMAKGRAKALPSFFI